MTWLSGQGETIRTTPVVPVQMIIFDGRTAIVDIDPDTPQRGAVQLSSPGVVGALHALFERGLDRGEPVRPARRAGT